MNTKTTIAAFLTLLTISACSENPTQPNDDTKLTMTHTAFVELENNRPVLYIQGPADNAPRRIHFDGTAEDLPGNDPRVPKLDDANIIALHSPRWSPDGARLAFVASTAFDQAELIVIDADGTHPRIVSVSSQYVIGDVDWSTNGKLIAYTMATRSNASGIELFVSDVDARTFRQLTQSLGPTSAVRFDASGSYIFFAKKVGEESGAPFNAITDIRRVSVNGGAAENIATGVVGEVEGVERVGGGALILRNTGWPAGGAIPRELSRVSLSGAAPRILATGVGLQFARYTQDDAFALLLTQTGAGSAAPYAYHIMSTLGGTPAFLRGMSEAGGGLDVRVATN